MFKKFGLCRICLRELAHNGSIRGLDVTITTSAGTTDEQALALLRGLGLPFASDDRKDQ